MTAKQLREVIALGRLSSWIVGLVLVALGILLAPRTQARRAPGRVAAATENQLCTRAAIAQMRSGGNAVDAAVAAALVGGVVSPTSSGIGGGGFALVWSAAQQQPTLLDFRETAPQRVDVHAFERRPLPARERGQLIGVPGEIRGLYRLHRRFGKQPWRQVVAPAIGHASHGFAVGVHLGRMLKSRRTRLLGVPGLATLFYRNGRPSAVGSLVTNPKLAETLRRVADRGPTTFYRGAVAADLVAAAKAAGGALGLDDLARYRCVERRPLHLRWEGYDVYTMPPPSAGGIMLGQLLTMFSKRELAQLGFNSGRYQHVLAEGMRGAVADRMRFLGDPDHTPVNIGHLLSKQRLMRRRGAIAEDRTRAIPRFGLEGHGTHHLVTADAQGNWVTLTTTVNRVFGAKVTGHHSAVVLNDELDDFTAQADVAPFGMASSPNRPRPGARPVSSMTPTLVVKDGQVVLGLGGSGGTAIATNVAQVLLSRLVFGHTPAVAAQAARFYVPTGPASIWLESGAPASLEADLTARGESVGTTPFTKSAVQIVALERGHLLAAADPRKHGSAAVR